jgi:ketosteroid isomerase-like protein
MAHRSVSELVRRYYAAFHAKDRNALDAAMTDDFSFTSPLDDHIDKTAFFERCLPNADKLRGFRIETLVESGDEVFVRYRCERVADGVAFGNVEYVRMQGTRIKEVEVYFGR